MSTIHLPCFFRSAQQGRKVCHCLTLKAISIVFAAAILLLPMASLRTHAIDLIWTGEHSGVWDKNTTSNWKYTTNVTTFVDGDQVHFDTVNTIGPFTIVIDPTGGSVSGAVGIGGMTVSGIGNYTITGPIRASTTYPGGTGALTKSGTGILTLGGGHGMMFDAVNLSGGTIIANTGSLSTSSTGGNTVVTLAAGTELRFNTAFASDIYSFSGPISGAGAIAKTGTGTMVLTGANSYSGTTNVNAGILMGNISSSTNLTVAAGAIYQTGDGTGVFPSLTADANRTVASLNGAGTVNMRGKDLTVSGGDFSLGTFQNLGSLIKNGVGAFTVGTATAANLTVNVGTFTVAETQKLTVSGATVIGNGATLNLAALPGLSTGSLTIDNNAILDICGCSIDGTIRTSTMDISGQFSHYYVGGVQVTNTVDINQIVNGVTVNYFTNAQGGARVEVRNGGLIWYNNNSQVPNQAHGTFNVASTFTVTQTLADRLLGDFDPVNAWNGKTLTKVGVGTLTLAAANTYSGGTAINAGTVIAKNASALGSGAVNLLGALVLDFNGAFANDLTGSGSLAITNSLGVPSNAVSIANPNNSVFSGQTTINSGATLNMGDIGAVGSSGIVNAGTLNVGFDGTMINGLSGGGALNINNNNNVVIAQANSGYTGNTTIGTGSTLSLRNVNGIGSGGTLTNNNLLYFNLSSGGIFNRVISGSGGVTVNVNGILTLAGANTYTGPTVVNTGHLIADLAPSGTALTVAAGATYQAQSNGQYLSNLTGAGTVNMSTYNLDIAAGNFANGVIDNANALTKSTTGELTVGTVNAGSLNLAAGTLHIAQGKKVTLSSDANIADNTSMSVGSGLSLDSRGQITVGTTATALDVQGYVPVSIITPTVLIHADGGISNDFNRYLIGGGEVATGISLDRFISNVTISRSTTDDIAIWGGGYVWNNTSLNSAHGTFNVATEYTLTEVLEDKSNTSTFFEDSFGNKLWDGETLTKTGAGTLILDAANAYSGGTTITTGKVVSRQTAALGTGTARVAAGASLDLDYNGIFNNLLTGDGSLAIVNSDGILGSEVVINQANTGFNGSTTINSGAALVLNDWKGVGSGAITNNGSLTLGNFGATHSFDNDLSGSGHLNINGVVTISQENAAFTGTTAIARGGVLNMNNALAIGAGDIAIDGDLNLNGFTSIARGSLPLANSLSGSGRLNVNSDVTIARDNSLFNGNTTISSSHRLNMGDTNAVGSSAILINTGGELALGFEGVLHNDISGQGNLAVGNTVAIAQGNANFEGTAIIAPGASLTLNAEKALGSASKVTIDGIGANLGTLNFGTGSEGDFASAISGDGQVIVNLTTGDTLTLLGDNSSTGPTIINQGTLAVGNAPHSVVRIAGDVVVEKSGAILSGFGYIDGRVAVKSGGTISPGGSLGTLTLGNGIQFETGSTYIYEIEPTNPAGHDLLVVSGGQVEIQPGANLDIRLMYPGTTQGELQVISADQAQFADQTLFTIANSWSTLYDQRIRSNGYWLTWQRISDLSSIADGPNMQEIADALDWADDNGIQFTDELQKALSDLMNASERTEAIQRLRELSPAVLAGGLELSPMIARQFNRSLNGMWRRKWLEDELASHASGNALPRLNPSIDRRLRFWAEGTGAWHKYDSPNGDPGYSAKEWAGTVAGYAPAGCSGVWNIGAALNVNRTKMDWDYSLGKTTGDGFAGALLAAFDTGPWVATANLAWGTTEIESRRQLPLTGLSASADYRTHWYGGEVMAGYRLRPGEWAFTPSAGMRVYQFDSPSVAEKGAGTAGLAMSRDHRTGVEMLARLDISRIWHFNNGVILRPHGFASAEVEMADQLATPGISFVGAPAGMISFNGHSPRSSRLSGRAGLGLDMRMNDRWTVYAEYFGEFCSRNQTHGGRIGVGLSF